MVETKPPGTAASSLHTAIDNASKGLVDRRGLVETIVLAAVAREHLLVTGPPGTAKSEAVRRIARTTAGRYFEYLIGRFTEPSEIFGPMDLRKLREGTVETQTSGMLPEADFAFLDEIFLGSTAILNTLLGILNERVFRRGHTIMPCPLRICVGATNRLPESEPLAAFADRFLVRVFTEPISDSRLEELLEGGWAADRSGGVSAAATVSDIDALAQTARQMDMTGVRPLLAQAIRMLRGAGVNLTDRRVVKVQHLISAAAALAGREQATKADLWPVVLAVPTREDQAVARDCLRDFLVVSENDALMHAVEETSLGPLARASRIAAAGRELLASGPGDTLEEWTLKLEGIAREIDAGFSIENMPVELSDVRARIVAEFKRESPASEPVH